MDTFFWYGKLATLGDLDGFDGSVTSSFGDVLDSLNDFVALEDFAEDDVLAIEMAVLI